MTVEIERDGDVAVPQSLANDLRMDILEQHLRRMCMTKIVKPSSHQTLFLHPVGKRTAEPIGEPWITHRIRADQTPIVVRCTKPETTLGLPGTMLAQPLNSILTQINAAPRLVRLRLLEFHLISNLLQGPHHLE